MGGFTRRIGSEVSDTMAVLLSNPTAGSAQTLKVPFTTLKGCYQLEDINLEIAVIDMLAET